MNQQIELRPIAEDDLEFLYSVYASTRLEELSPVPWSDEQKTEFLQMQFNAQHTEYQKNYPDARFDVILVDDMPVGRLYVDRRDDELRIVDIALLPQYRGKGIGGGIVQDLLDEAARGGKPVRIYVESNNRAMVLYERLGFSKIDQTGVYHLMAWTPDNQQAE